MTLPALSSRDIEADSGQQNFDGGGAVGFLKRRRGNFGEARLFVVDPGAMRAEPIERRTNLGILR